MQFRTEQETDMEFRLRLALAEEQAQEKIDKLDNALRRLRDMHLSRSPAQDDEDDVLFHASALMYMAARLINQAHDVLRDGDS